MHIPLITGFYAGLLGLILLVLTMRVILVRVRTKIALMDGGNRELGVAMRQAGNFVELVPFCVILLAILEMAASSIYAIHVLGIILVVARFVHPFGVNYEKPNEWQRVFGAAATELVLLVASVWTIYLFVARALLVP